MIDLRSYNKETRSMLANVFYPTMSEKYANEIAECINRSSVYNRLPESQDAVQDIIDEVKMSPAARIHLVPTDSVSCLFKYATARDSKTAVLNFASFKHPGGMFLNGSSAQEESLCHQSILYPVLLAFVDNYYAPHQKTLNHGLYQDEAIYSKDVLFFDYTLEHTVNNGKPRFDYKLNAKTTADVITCAAPNAKAFLRRKHGLRWEDYLLDDEVVGAMHDRILTVLDSAVIGGARTLILGAFGCGVFGNDPGVVADYFYDYLTDDYAGCFDDVYFAVPKYDKSGRIEPNYKEFRNYIDMYDGDCLED
ncbi:MAG: TIGR02452 family protein [Lachnospiraceae bacterium]|nr:TIGR02452 family protein [Lachnospiraceae bacterium]